MSRNTEPRDMPQGIWQTLLRHAFTLIDEIARLSTPEPYLTRHRETFLSQLEQRRAVLSAQFEAIDTLEYRPSYNESLERARIYLSQLT